MKNKKGFTLIEILAAIVIIALLTGIGIVSISKMLNVSERNYYRIEEENIRLAAIEFIKSNKTEAPIKGQTTILELSTLIKTKFMDEVYDAEGNACYDGKVYISVNNKNSYEYKTCLKCGKYSSPEDNCKFEYPKGNLNVSLSTKSVDNNGNNVTLTGYDPNYVWAKNDVIMDLSISEPEIDKYIINRDGKFYTECIVKSADKSSNSCRVNIPINDLKDGSTKFKVIANDIYGGTIERDNIIIKADTTSPTGKVVYSNPTYGNNVYVLEDFNSTKINIETQITLSDDAFSGSGIDYVNIKYIDADNKELSTNKIDGTKIKDKVVSFNADLNYKNSYKVEIEIRDNAGNTTKFNGEEILVAIPLKLNYNLKGKAEVSELVYFIPNKDINYIKNNYKENPAYKTQLPTKDKQGYDVKWNYVSGSSLIEINTSNLTFTSPTNLYLSYDMNCEYKYISTGLDVVNFQFDFTKINPNFLVTKQGATTIVTSVNQSIETAKYYPNSYSSNPSSKSCTLKGSVINKTIYSVLEGIVKEYGGAYQVPGCLSHCPPYDAYITTRLSYSPNGRYVCSGPYCGTARYCISTGKDSNGLNTYKCQIHGSWSSAQYWEDTAREMPSKTAAENECNKTNCRSGFKNDGNRCIKNQDKICTIREKTRLDYEY